MVEPRRPPSAPRLPRSVQRTANHPTFAALKASAREVLKIRIDTNSLEAKREPEVAILTKFAQGETFEFPQGKVQVTRATKEEPLDTYDIEFDQDAWDALVDTEQRQRLQEQLLKLGVVRLVRSVKKAHPSQVKVFLAERANS